MLQFDNVLRELRLWLFSFPIVNKLTPFGLQIMIGSLGCSMIYEFILLFNYFSLLNVLSAIGHYGFLLGFWLVLIDKNIKYAPYGLFGKAFILLFPFTSFYLSTILGAGMYLYFGYCLMKYTALSAECQ